MVGRYIVVCYIQNVFGYKKDCEVTCKFVNAKDRTKIFNFLYKIRFGPADLERIMLRSGQLVDFTVKRKSYASVLAKKNSK